MRKLYELSELETIGIIRKQIKSDVEEYHLFRQTLYIAKDKFNFYRDHLLEQIQINIGELQRIVEDKNE